MDMLVEGEEMEVSRSVPTSESSSSEQDRSQVVLKAMFNGKRLMIIELGKYNSAEELLIETRTTGLQGHIYYRGKDWRTSITRAAVCMGLEGTGMRTGHRGAYKWAPSRE